MGLLIASSSCLLLAEILLSEEVAFLPLDQRLDAPQVFEHAAEFFLN